MCPPNFPTNKGKMWLLNLAKVVGIVGSILMLIRPSACNLPETAMISKSPLKVDLTESKSGDFSFAVNVPGEVLEITALRPDKNCLTGESKDNTVNFNYGKDNCDVTFSWSLETFNVEGKPLVMKQNVIISFGKNASASAGNESKEMNNCNYAPIKDGHTYKATFTILKPEKAPKCNFLIVFDPSVTLFEVVAKDDNDDDSSFIGSLLMWLIVGVIVVLCLCGSICACYCVYKKKQQDMEESKVKFGDEEKKDKAEDETETDVNTVVEKEKKKVQVKTDSKKGGVIDKKVEVKKKENKGEPSNKKVEVKKEDKSSFVADLYTKMDRK